MVRARLSLPAVPQVAMKSNWKFALTMVAVLGAVAAALWWTRQQQLSVNQARTGEPQQPAVAVPLPVAATDVAPPEAPTLTHLAMPPTPSQAEYSLNAQRGEFVMESLADVPKALRMATEAVGEPKALQELQVASWRIFMGGAMQWSGSLVADTKGGAVLRSDETQQEIGWQSGTCWQRRGEVVYPCTQPVASLVRALQWFHYAQVVSAFGQAPWRPAIANLGLANNRRANAITFENGPMGESGVLFCDLHSRRVAGVEIPKIYKDGVETATGTADMLPLHASIWLDDPRPFGNAVLAGAARIHIESGIDIKEELVVRVLDVRAGGTVPAKAPVLHLPTGLQIGPRLGGSALVHELGQHASFHERIDQVMLGMNSFYVSAAFDVVEAFGPLGQPTDSGVQLWLWPQSPAALMRPGVAAVAKPVASEGTTVRKVVQVELAGVPGALAVLMGEAEKAGHKPAPGRRATATYLAWTSGDHPTVTVLLALPIEAN